MRHTILIVPGFRGSGPAHWQTWTSKLTLIRLPEVGISM